MTTIVMKEVEMIQKNFLWGWGLKGRKIAWVAWNKVCEPKEKRGLGVIDIRMFNYAILGKWIWRLMS